MVALYALAQGQLSAQAHYDWGLRALKAVLVMAGALKRADPDPASACPPPWFSARRCCIIAPHDNFGRASGHRYPAAPPPDHHIVDLYGGGRKATVRRTRC